MNALVPALLIALAPMAEGTPAPDREPAPPADAPSTGRELDELKAEREKKVKERDEALVRANIYVLPKDKLRAQELQAEIDALDARIAELEKKTK